MGGWIQDFYQPFQMYADVFQMYAEQTLQHCLDFHILKRMKEKTSTNRNCYDLYQTLTIQLNQNNNRAQQSDHVLIVSPSDHPVLPVK